MTTPTLEAHVVVRRPEFELDVDLSMAPGEVVLLTGDNGAGKSTLVRAIAGSLPLDAGRIAIDGTVVDEPATRTWVPPERRGVGIVHQDARPFPHLSVVDNVAFGLRARGMPRAGARSASAALLADHGLTSLAGRRGSDVSGGEGRRIVLARALTTGPSLLLLDEPLSSIDAGARAALAGVLASLAAEHSTAILLVTHDPDETGALADRVIRLERGGLSGAGPGAVT